MEPRIVIVGAGPTGLGAAYQLNALGYTNWAVYEKNNYIGGLSASFKDKKGFTWDIGGHILFSRYDFFDNLLNRLLGDQYLEHNRKTYIWAVNSWVPYPFQNNVRFLPKKVTLECIMGLIDVEKTEHSPSNYKEWLFSVFGAGIAKYFVFPHNAKLWCYPLEMMDKNWSWNRASRKTFPPTTGDGPHYLPDKRTCVLPVKLMPARTYAIWLNSDNFKNFKDTEGRPAVPYLLIFETGK